MKTDLLGDWTCFFLNKLIRGFMLLMYEVQNVRGQGAG